MEPSTANPWNAVATAWQAQVGAVEAFTEPAMSAMIDALDVRPGDRVVELAAGVGTLGRRWSALVGEHGHVLISDLAAAMVAAAQQANQGLANVEVRQLDLTAIDLPDASADVIACRMGLMFVADPDAAWREIARVLAPGGRAAVITLAGPDDNPWLACVGFAAMVQGIDAGAAPTAPGGVFSLGDPQTLQSGAVGAGLGEVRVTGVPLTFNSPTIVDHVDVVGALAGPLASALAEASDEQRAAVVSTAGELAAAYISERGVSLPGLARLVVGRRPAA